MAKAPKKKSSPILWVGLASLAIAAYVLTSPETPAKRSGKVRPKAVAKATKITGVLPADYEARFGPVNMPATNAFKPLVARAAKATNTAPKPIPGGTIGMGGAPSGWKFTGMATIDGVPTALLEGPGGDSQFVRLGQKWQGATVVRISSEGIGLRGAAGRDGRAHLLRGDRAAGSGGGRVDHHPRRRGNRAADRAGAAGKYRNRGRPPASCRRTGRRLER